MSSPAIDGWIVSGTCDGKALLPEALNIYSSVGSWRADVIGMDVQASWSWVTLALRALEAVPNVHTVRKVASLSACPSEV